MRACVRVCVCVRVCLSVCLSVCLYFVPCGKIGVAWPYCAWLKHSSRKSERYPFLPVCVVFPRVQNTSVAASQCLGFLTCARQMHAIALTRELCGHCKKVCTGSCPRHGETESLTAPGLEPASVLRLAFQSDTLPTEQYPHPPTRPPHPHPHSSPPPAIISGRRVR